MKPRLITVAVAAAMLLGAAPLAAGAAAPAANVSLPPMFAVWQQYWVGSHPATVVTGDFTGDGRLDVVMVTGFYFDPANDHKVFLFAQTAAGSLAPPVRMDTSAVHNGDEMGAAAGDVNGDGKTDLAVASSKGIDVFLQGAATLLPARLVDLYGAQEVSLVDVNGDGRLDLVVETLTNVVALNGNGDGTFAAPREVVARRFLETETADVTGDGMVDVVGFVDYSLQVMANRGDGTWAPPVDYGGDPADTTSLGIALGDFTGDGRADVAWSTGGNVKVFAQRPDGTLAPPVRYRAPAHPLEAADVDGDGRMDLVDVTSGGSQVGVQLQLADGTLAPRRTFTIAYAGTPPTTKGLATGDVNGDGLPDILVADGNTGLQVLRSTTQARTWGLGNLGQLGSGGTASSSQPVAPLTLSGVAAASAGAHHTLALSHDGTVSAWGLNHVGQLGIGSTTDRAVPTKVPGLSRVVAVAGGTYHSLAVREDGTVWSWGWNGYGQLGVGDKVNRSSPVQVPGLPRVVAVAAGGTHSLAVTASGDVWAWGLNHVGQLGTGGTLSTAVPIRVPSLSGVASVAAGQFHSLALTGDGRVLSWGYNNFGQLGTGSAALFDPAPRQLPTLVAVKAVSAGAMHSVALAGNGYVSTWGLNNVGELGDGTTQGSGVPTPVSGSGPYGTGPAFLDNIVSVTAGWYHTLAVDRNGTTWAWGWNYFGQLGTGTTADRLRPTAVPGLRPTVLAGGVAHSFALTARGA